MKFCPECGTKQDESSNVNNNTVTVSKNGNADFKTIQEALDNVKEDATINVMPGLYNEHLIFKKNVHLLGCTDDIKNKSSNELPIVVLDSSKSCEIDIPVEIEGIVFTHEENLNFANLNDFINQKIDFKDNVYEDCSFGDNNFKSLFWIKSNAHLNNIAVLCAKCYAVTFSEGDAVFENSIVFHSYDDCIYCRRNANPKILNCIISNSRYKGIEVRDKATPEIINCNIHDNPNGIYVEDAAPHIKECKIYNNNGIGIDLCYASGSYEDCIIHDNGKYKFNGQKHDITDKQRNNCTGISVGLGGTPSINRCEIYNHVGCGISIDGEGTCRDCVIHDNESFGLWVWDSDSNPSIIGCEIYKNIEDGIKVDRDACGTYENCDIHDNDYGITAADSANPSVRNCKIYHNASSGLFVTDKAEGNYISCNIQDNEYGVWVVENANPHVKECKICNNDSGFIILYSSTGVYEDCSINNNKHGVIVSNDANPVINTCEIYNNKFFGVGINENAGGSYNDCYIHDNEGSGFDDSRTIQSIDTSTCIIINNQD